MDGRTEGREVGRERSFVVGPVDKCLSGKSRKP